MLVIVAFIDLVQLLMADVARPSISVPDSDASMAKRTSERASATIVGTDIVRGRPVMMDGLKVSLMLVLLKIVLLEGVLLEIVLFAIVLLRVVLPRILLLEVVLLKVRRWLQILGYCKIPRAKAQ